MYLVNSVPKLWLLVQMYWYTYKYIHTIHVHACTCTCICTTIYVNSLQKLGTLVHNNVLCIVVPHHLNNPQHLVEERAVLVQHVPEDRHKVAPDAEDEDRVPPPLLHVAE